MLMSFPLIRWEGSPKDPLSVSSLRSGVAKKVFYSKYEYHSCVIPTMAMCALLLVWKPPV